MKKILSLMLVLLMCAPAFLSCAETEETAAEDGTPSVSADSAEEEALPEETEISRKNTPDTLPDDLDFGGETVTIHVRGGTTDEAYIEEMTGEIVNDTVYERNALVCERLNVNIEAFEAEGWETYNNAIASMRSSIMAADGAFDIIAGWSARIPALSLEGLMTDIHSLPHINLEQPWWNQSSVEELDIAGKLHFVTGDIAKSLLSAMFLFTFNQKLANDYELENLYDVVKEYRWTIDYVYNISSAAYIDVDGNGQATEADSYGLITSCINDADSFLQGSHVSMVSRDENGFPILDVNEERMTTIVEKVYNLFWNNPGCRAHTGGLTERTIFVEGRSLLVTASLGDLASTFVEMEDDFGVLPYPMLDESQGKYGTRVQDALSLWCVPIDAKNPAMSAAVLEALAAQSYRTVTPAYYDVALKDRYSRDEQTAEMIDLIQSSALINFEQLYNESIGNPWFVLRTLMPAKDSNYASYWAKNSKPIGKMLQKAVEKIQANG